MASNSYDKDKCITISSDDENDCIPKIIDTVSLSKNAHGNTFKKYEVFNDKNNSTIRKQIFNKVSQTKGNAGLNAKGNAGNNNVLTARSTAVVSARSNTVSNVRNQNATVANPIKKSLVNTYNQKIGNALNARTSTATSSNVNATVKFNQNNKPGVSQARNIPKTDVKRVKPTTIQVCHSVTKKLEPVITVSDDCSNTELFAKFQNACQKLGGVGLDNLTKISNKVDRAYKSANPEYVASDTFKNLLKTSINGILNSSGTKPWHIVRSVVQELKHHKLSKKNKTNVVPSSGEGFGSVPGTSKEEPINLVDEEDELEIKDPKKRKQIKKLESALKKVNIRIQQLEEKDQGLDDLDDEDSAYIKLDRYKTHFTKIYKKICELLDKPADAERPFLRKISFSGSPYPEVNRCLEKFYNTKREFPDFQDVKKLVQNINKTKSMGWQPIKVHDIAEKTFKEFGEMLKKIRQHDDYEVMASYLPNRDDPAKQDAELRQKLQQNALINKRREQEVIDTYVNKQMEGNDKEAESNKSDSKSEQSDQETSENEDEKDIDAPLKDFTSDEEIIQNDKSSFVTYLGLYERENTSAKPDNQEEENLEVNDKLENKCVKVDCGNLESVENMEIDDDINHSSEVETQEPICTIKQSLLSSSDSSDGFSKTSFTNEKSKTEINFNECRVNKNIRLNLSDESDSSASETKSVYDESETKQNDILSKSTDAVQSGNTETQSLSKMITDMDDVNDCKTIPVISKVKKCEQRMDFSDNSGEQSMKKKIELLTDEFSNSEDEGVRNKRRKIHLDDEEEEGNLKKKSFSSKKESESDSTNDEDEYKLPQSKIISLNESNAKKHSKKKIVYRPMRKITAKKIETPIDDSFYKIPDHILKINSSRAAKNIYFSKAYDINAPSTSANSVDKLDKVTDQMHGKSGLKNKNAQTKVKNMCEYNSDKNSSEEKEDDPDVIVKCEQDFKEEENANHVEEKALVQFDDDNDSNKEEDSGKETPVIIRVFKKRKTHTEAKNKSRNANRKPVIAKKDTDSSDTDDIVLVNDEPVLDSRPTDNSSSDSEGFFQDVNELCEVKLSDCESDPVSIYDSDSADSSKTKKPPEAPQNHQKESSPDLCIVETKLAPNIPHVRPAMNAVRNMPVRKPTNQNPVRIAPVRKPAVNQNPVRNVPVRKLTANQLVRPTASTRPNLPINSFMNRTGIRGFIPRATSTPSRQVQSANIRQPQPKFRASLNRGLGNSAQPTNQQRQNLPNTSRKIVNIIRTKPNNQQARRVTNGVLPTNVNRINPRTLQSNKVPAEIDVIVLD